MIVKARRHAAEVLKPCVQPLDLPAAAVAPELAPVLRPRLLAVRAVRRDQLDAAFGDRPQLDMLIGSVKVMLDGYSQDRFDRLMLFYTRFLNTMKQEPVMEQLLPLTGELLGAPQSTWDYLYEPDAL